ncbi:hypothetical protein [Streptomyces sp. NPDC058653]|uniref:hypothetical protein n=1 Tax=Streptomyces sp. NPDC058653 TaxID=3346576 RepID=UPI00365014D4
MRAIRAASAALLGAAALALTTPAVAMPTAAAPTPFGFAVTPSVIAAGGQVTLTVTGCSSTATAESGVFDDTPIPSGGSARASIFWDAKPGAMYEVTFICNGQRGTTDLTIAGGTPSPTPTRTSTPTPTPTPSPAVTRTAATTSSTAIAPPGGVRGGLGGSFMGMNATELAVGTGLVAAAAAGTVLVVRRRSASREH